MGGSEQPATPAPDAPGLGDLAVVEAFVAAVACPLLATPYEWISAPLLLRQPVMPALGGCILGTGPSAAGQVPHTDFDVRDTVVDDRAGGGSGAAAAAAAPAVPASTEAAAPGPPPLIGFGRGEVRPADKPHFLMLSGADGFVLRVWPHAHQVRRGLSTTEAAEGAKSMRGALLVVPPWSVVVAGGDVTHAGASFRDNAAADRGRYANPVRYHTYLSRAPSGDRRPPSDVSLSDADGRGAASQKDVASPPPPRAVGASNNTADASRPGSPGFEEDKEPQVFMLTSTVTNDDGEQEERNMYRWGHGEVGDGGSTEPPVVT